MSLFLPCDLVLVKCALVSGEVGTPCSVVCSDQSSHRKTTITTHTTPTQAPADGQTGWEEVRRGGEVASRECVACGVYSLWVRAQQRATSGEAADGKQQSSSITSGDC